MASGKSRAKSVVGKTTNLTASRGNAGKNKAQSILREIRADKRIPDVIYGRNGNINMNARERRAYVSNISGRKLNSRYHVHFTKDKKLNKVTTSGGIRRTLEGYRISITYS